jgi:hypothetical protein
MAFIYLTSSEEGAWWEALGRTPRGRMILSEMGKTRPRIVFAPLEEMGIRGMYASGRHPECLLKAGDTSLGPTIFIQEDLPGIAALSALAHEATHSANHQMGRLGNLHNLHTMSFFRRRIEDEVTAYSNGLEVGLAYGYFSDYDFERAWATEQGLVPGAEGFYLAALEAMSWNVGRLSFQNIVRKQLWNNWGGYYDSFLEKLDKVRDSQNALREYHERNVSNLYQWIDWRDANILSLGPSELEKAQKTIDRLRAKVGMGRILCKRYGAYPAYRQL